MKNFTQASLFVLILLSTALGHSTESHSFKLKKLAKSSWTLATSDNFRILTDANEKDARGYLLELEEFRHFVYYYLKQPSVADLPPPTFIMLQKKRNYESFPLSKNVSGIFFVNINGFYSIARAENFKRGQKKPSSGRNTILHELTHFLTAKTRYEKNSPLWYTEGIADYLSTYFTKGDRIHIGDLGPLHYRYYALPGYTILGKTGPFYIEELINSPYSNYTEFNEEELSVFYARSMLAVHFFASHPQKDRMLMNFFHLTQTGMNTDTAFGKAFGVPYETINQEIEHYISQEHLYGYSFPKGVLKFPSFKIQTQKIEKKPALIEILSVVKNLPPTVERIRQIVAAEQDFDELEKQGKL